MFRQQTKTHLWLAAISIGLILLTLASGDLFSQTTTSAWRLVRLPLDESVTGVSFPTPTVGYIVTSGGKYGITRDGGRNWNVWNLRGAPPLEDVYFKSRDTGIAVGRRGAIYRTINGAKQWEQRPRKDSLTTFTSGVFLDDTIALVAGFRPDSSRAGKLYRSVDAAQHWEAVAVTGIGFGEIFYHSGSPVCFQSYGKLHYSEDLGKTWKTLQTLNGKPGRATAFYNKTGVICGGGGMLAISSDRGANWNLVQTENQAEFTSALLVNDTVGFIAGVPALIMYTVDAGKTWRKVDNLPDPSDIAALALARDKIFAVGAAGAIYSAPWKEVIKTHPSATKPSKK